MLILNIHHLLALVNLISKGVCNSICFLRIYTEHWCYTNGNRETFKETHDCLFSGKIAERAHKMIMKDAQVYIKESLHYFLPTNSEIKSKRHTNYILAK